MNAEKSGPGLGLATRDLDVREFSLVESFPFALMKHLSSFNNFTVLF
jgi:hypothetical protein